MKCIKLHGETLSVRVTDEVARDYVLHRLADYVSKETWKNDGRHVGIPKFGPNGVRR